MFQANQFSEKPQEWSGRGIILPTTDTQHATLQTHSTHKSHASHTPATRQPHASHLRLQQNALNSNNIYSWSIHMNHSMDQTLATHGIISQVSHCTLTRATCMQDNPLASRPPTVHRRLQYCAAEVMTNYTQFVLHNFIELVTSHNITQVSQCTVIIPIPAHGISKERQADTNPQHLAFRR